MRWRIAVFAAAGLVGCGPGDGSTDLALSPAEVRVDLGVAWPYEEVTRSFTITAEGGTDRTIALAPGTRLPEGFALEPLTATVGPGRPATFTLTLGPCGAPGNMGLDFFLEAPDARVHVIARGIVQSVDSEGPGCLDFGAVMLGESRSLPLSVVNVRGPDPLRVESISRDDAFPIEPAFLDVPRGESGDFTVTFAPPARGASETYVYLERPIDRCPYLPEKRCVRGMAIIEAFELDPATLHFDDGGGCRDVTVRNNGDVAIHVRSVVLTDGLVRVPGAFTVEGEDPMGREVKPQEAASFQLCFAPPGDAYSFEGELRVATDNQSQAVPVTARSP